MKTHRLKIWPEFFQLINEGKKDWELRKNDRGYIEGDYLELWEYVPETGYTEEHIVVRVTHVFKGGKFGLEEGYCIMSIKRI